MQHFIWSNIIMNQCKYNFRCRLRIYTLFYFQINIWNTLGVPNRHFWPFFYKLSLYWKIHYSKLRSILIRFFIFSKNNFHVSKIIYLLKYCPIWLETISNVFLLLIQATQLLISRNQKFFLIKIWRRVNKLMFP